MTPSEQDKLAAQTGSMIRAVAIFLVYLAVKHGLIPQAIAGVLGDTLTLYLATGLTALAMFLWSWVKNHAQHDRIAQALISDPTLNVDDFLAKVKANSVAPAASERGFAWLIIPVILAGGFLVATIAKVHIPLLNPQTKIQAAKTDRFAFEAVRAFQVEEEKLWHTRAVPQLAVADASGKTLHQRINVEVLAIYKLIEQVDTALLKLPTGGTLALSDLGFVSQLEAAVVRLLDLAKPALGAALSAAIEQVNAQIAAFSAAAKAVK